MQHKVHDWNAGRKRPITARQKTAALKRLRTWVRRVPLDGEAEYIAEIDPAGVAAALDVLRVVHHRSTFGISRPFGRSRVPVKQAV